ncbi:MAG: MFS transporter [Candidatus Caldarchaeum sp.]|nr:MFS transporter [Candidatus Caldarchaeum sp.]MDW8360373.1 MFS transporter [Candidatus Caldarchaeum sp.]
MKEAGLSLTVARNTGLLAATQALNSLIVQVLVVYAPIAILLLGGSASLAGLGMAFVWGGRLVSTFQMGLVMDRVGRRPVIAGGMAVAAVSMGIAVYALNINSIMLFLATLLLYGVGRGMTEYSRVAVADILPSHRRGLGTGIVLTGSIAGTLAAPVLIYSTSSHSTSVLSNIVESLNYTILIGLAGVAVASMVWPDPLKIAKLLNNPEAFQQRGLRKISNPSLLVAILSVAASTGVMVAIMSLNTVVMYEHQHTAVDISTVVMIHVIGMYAFSIPLGRLSDRYGRKSTILSGLLAEVAGVMMLLVSDLMVVVATALFLVGVGWSAVWVASAAYIADLTAPNERGAVSGVADASAAGASILLPIVSGVALEAGGIPSLVALCTAVSLPTMAACIKIMKK